ncbi:MAG: acetyltransferase [Lutibacter sp.]
MYLYGASGHAKVIIDIIKSSSNLKIDGIFDDNENLKQLLGIPVRKIQNLTHLKNKSFIISIGDNLIRKKIVEMLQSNFEKAVHNSAIISANALVGEGTVVMPKVVINSGAKIGNHCILNSASVIEHDCELGDYVHISPNAAIAGNVKIGEGSHIGIGANIIQGVTIGKWVTVGAGAVVINDVPDGQKIVGIPAKPIKYHSN